MTAGLSRSVIHEIIGHIAGAIAAVMLICSIAALSCLVPGCGDNVVPKQLTPVEMCGQPPAIPAQWWWFENGLYTDPLLVAACTAEGTFDLLRDYQERVVRWQWCIKEIQ